MFSYEQARRTIVEKVQDRRCAIAGETLAVWDALGYVLAEEIKADREYPPFNRSTRDGFAVRAENAKAGAKLRCVGEIKAGDSVVEELQAGTCIQIMTGAAVPPSADAVVMIEHTRRDGETVEFLRPVQLGQNIVPKGSEARAGEILMAAGTRLGYAELSLAAQVGAEKVRCARKPRVAILSTGDEIVSVESTPGPFHIRNSNSVSLAAQVRLAGGEPVMLGNAADRKDDLRAKIESGLREPVLVLSGGVSMGKYDLVETVLQEMGAKCYFDAVAIRPGKPAVFGRCGNTFVFGLPGNPVSTMVTFELFVTPALDILSGAQARPLLLVQARLGEGLKEKTGLAHFLPARLQWHGMTPEVKALRWQGSGDIAALAKANCFIVVPADREEIAAGETVSILLRKDVT